MDDSPPTTPAARIDVALVLDDAPSRLDHARACLDELQRRYAAELSTWDLLFLDPGLLVCLLHFDVQSFSADALVPLARVAREHGLRVLKPTLIASDESQRLYADRLNRFTFRLLEVHDVAAGFTVLAERLRAASATARPLPAGELRFTVRFADPSAFRAAYSPGPDDAPGRLHILSQAVPPAGATLPLTLTVGASPRCFDVLGRVIAPGAAPPLDEPDEGFSVELVVPPGRASDFAGFLTSVDNRQPPAPAPAAAPAREERPNIRLPVEYLADERRVLAFTRNLNLGGLFLECDNPPAVDTQLALQLFAVGRTHCVPLLGRVAHRLSKPRAAAVSGQPGAGIEFLEPRDAVAAKLTQIVGSLTAPVVPRAMVVDDDRFFRVLLTTLLANEGFSVMEAADGQEAFARLLETLLGLNLLLVDLNLPGTSGQELIEMVRSVGGQEDLPVIVITGAALNADEVAAIRQLGADAVLAKALTAEQLWEEIARVLKAHHRQRQHAGA